MSRKTARIFALCGCAIGIFLALAVQLTSADEPLFGYREDPEDNPGRQNAMNRTPIYIPGRCGENEILYPGDQENDWVCDCRPAHVYHPVSAGCFPLYTQAYCKEGQYVEIKPGSKLPTCTTNTCEKGLVPFNGQCVYLHKNNEGVCPTIQRIRHVVGVNEVTLQLDCISRAPLELTKILMRRNDYQDADIEVTKEGYILFRNVTRSPTGTLASINATQEENPDEAADNGQEVPPASATFDVL